MVGSIIKGKRLFFVEPISFAATSLLVLCFYISEPIHKKIRGIFEFGIRFRVKNSPSEP